MNTLAAEVHTPPPPRPHPREALRELVSQRGLHFETRKELIEALAALPVNRSLEVRTAIGDECDRDGCFMVGERPYIVFWGEGDGVSYFPAR